MFSGILRPQHSKLDDIQELWRSTPTVIPDRYVRGSEDGPLANTFHGSMEQDVPVIDLAKLMGADPLEAGDELIRLNNACKDWGFFQIVNHGEEEMVKRIVAVTKAFFALPLEEKEKYHMVAGTLQGYGHGFVFSEDQKLDWCNMFSLALEPPSLRIPEKWPATPSDFSETLEAYSVSMKVLNQKLLALIAEGLGLKPSTFNDMFEHPVQAIRMNYYPPCARPDLVLGLSPHSDGSALTILYQDTHSVGLQILKDGVWLPVKPIPNALVVNIGDTLEVLTNGRYKSVEHRAVTNVDKDRLSVVTVYAPSYDIELGPMPELVSKDEPPVYRRYNHGEYSFHYITRKLDGKKALDFTKIQSSC